MATATSEGRQPSFSLVASPKRAVFRFRLRRPSRPSCTNCQRHRNRATSSCVWIQTNFASFDGRALVYKGPAGITKRKSQRT